MKELFYSLYSLFFNLSRKFFKVRNNRVVLLSAHNESFTDSLGAVGRLIENDGGFEVLRISGSDLKINKSGIGTTVKSLFRAVHFFTVGAFRLATAKYVFLNDNFMPMADLDFSNEAVITQLWHAEGAFKKFSLSLDLPEDIRKRSIEGCKKLTYVVCSSKGVVPVYAEAFNMPESRVLPLGSARTDEFFKSDKSAEIKSNLNSLYPLTKGKKLILYAPTFRDTAEDDAKLLDSFDFERFNREFGNEYALLVRLHPQIHRSKPLPDFVTDATSYKSAAELCLACDILITDYSSICMDFALLNKRCIFYAFDLQKYATERSFYFDYESFVPGDIAHDFDALVQAIKNPRNDEQKLARFREFNFDIPDGNAARRIIDTVMKASS